MNHVRRKKIDEVVKRIEELQSDFENLKFLVEEIYEEEQEYLDNIPENLQSGERYERAEESVEYLDEALSWFDGVDFDELTDALESAKVV